jgi:DNA-binding response OmpR family regulator
MTDTKPNFTGYKILIVDDEADLREILSEDFSQLGATVMTAKNGVDALEIALRESPHVILSDVRMAGGDGVELMRRVQAATLERKPQFFLMTGFADVDVVEAAKLGSDGLIAKPFSLRVLRDRVGQALKKTSA